MSQRVSGFESAGVRVGVRGCPGVLSTLLDSALQQASPGGHIHITIDGRERGVGEEIVEIEGEAEAEAGGLTGGSVEMRMLIQWSPRDVMKVRQ
eukprot:928112-Prorocentrum_minimum.AAC.1